jgi:putative oxidoreductase
MSNALQALRARALSTLDGLRDVALLILRISVGVGFASNGWDKLHNLENVGKFFASLGIPAPELNATVVGLSEFVCGATITIGLAARLSTVPLIVSMAVAILTAKLKDIHGPWDLFKFDEFTYMLVFVVIALLGPGSLSVDKRIAAKLEADAPKAGAA